MVAVSPFGGAKSDEKPKAASTGFQFDLVARNQVLPAQVILALQQTSRLYFWRNRCNEE